MVVVVVAVMVVVVVHAKKRLHDPQVCTIITHHNPLAASENAHISLTTWYIFVKFCIRMYVNIV